MYISTYIRNKNCHQHSYGFQNLMSSWGWGSKFSILKQVGDFSIFGSKSSHVQVVSLKIILALVFNIRLGTYKRGFCLPATSQALFRDSVFDFAKTLKDA